MDPLALRKIFEEQAAELGFSHFGWTALKKPVSFEIYRSWVADGQHGEMGYLERHLPFKENPSTRYPKATTALVFAFPYRPHPEPVETPLKKARIASYARGADYHEWLKARLQKLIVLMQEMDPAAHFEVHTDSSPLLERDLATQAGLGWIGKNTCSIHPKKGSFYLLGEILTSWSVANEYAPLPDFCGTCTRCIDVCPTKALTAPRVLDARKCISYLNIESRTLPPVELRSQIGDWLFGCDLCQSVCPWNDKPFKPTSGEKSWMLPNSPQDDLDLTEELRWILTSSGKSLEKAFEGTAMSRAGGFGLKRNALVVAGNRKFVALKNEVEALATHERLGELASWTLQQFISC